MANITFTVCIAEEDDGSYWAEVEELPGCFASGFSMDELKEAVEEAIQLYLPDGIKLNGVEWSDDRPRASSRHAKASPARRRMLVHA